jgi:hypothetical protein
MSEEPDLVRLLYRADWTRLSLAAGRVLGHALLRVARGVRGLG